MSDAAAGSGKHAPFLLPGGVSIRAWLGAGAALKQVAFVQEPASVPGVSGSNGIDEELALLALLPGKRKKKKGGMDAAAQLRDGGGGVGGATSTEVCTSEGDAGPGVSC